MPHGGFESCAVVATAYADATSSCEEVPIAFTEVSIAYTEAVVACAEVTTVCIDDVVVKTEDTIAYAVPMSSHIGTAMSHTVPSKPMP